MNMYMYSRAGTVHELSKSSRSKFKMVLHQFSSVQFLSHKFVQKVQFSSVRSRPLILKSSVSSVRNHAVQFSSVGTPDGAAFGVLLGIPRRVSLPVKCVK